MTEEGKVIKIENKDAIVRIERKSACAACGMCAMKPKDSHIDVRVENTLTAEKGDDVLVKIESGSVAKISLIVYILPLAIAVLGLLIGVICHFADWAVLVIFLGFLAVGFVIVILIDKKVAKSKKMQPVLLEIIKKEKQNNEC